MAYVPTPKYLLELHGAGEVPVGAPFPYPGGVFGQPSIPTNRQGIFESKWALPRRAWVDRNYYDVPGAKPSLRVYRSVPYSSGPVAGLADIPEGEQPTKISVLAAAGLALVAYFLGRNA